jgi:hypothetical protein
MFFGCLLDAGEAGWEAWWLCAFVYSCRALANLCLAVLPSILTALAKSSKGTVRQRGQGFATLEGIEKQ